MGPHGSTQIGTRDDTGRRTNQTPGDVCVECSDPETGRWVPVSFCQLQPAVDGNIDPGPSAGATS